MSKSRAPFTLIWLSAPGAKARHIDLPRGITGVLGAVTALSLCLSLGMGHKVRGWCDAEDLRRDSASQLAARDRAQSQAQVNARSPVFGAAQPRATYSQLAKQVLKLYDVNSQRTLAVSPFNADGEGDPAAFAQLREFMRCRRTGHTMDMSPELLLLLMRISAQFDGAELQVISAHRAVDGVVTSERSQHGKGTASDIRIAGVDVEQLAQVAHEQGAGGVGIYTRSRFVHVDVREEPFAWRGLDEGDYDDSRVLGDENGVIDEGAEEAVQAEPAAEADNAPGEPRREPKAAETAYQEETLEGKTLSGL